jgi:phosphoribosylanthranilate isomerase
MKIKICGMRDPENIQSLAELRPDYLGLIFYPGSQRYVGKTKINLSEELSSGIILTGVFVNESQEEILNRVKQYQLTAIQLHGQETPEYCRSLRAALNPENSSVEMIKAFGLDEAFNFDVLEQYDAFVDFFLFDTKSAEHGGSGRRFNWEIIPSYHLQKPYFLSGGIDLEDLEELKQLDDPRLYAVDLNSKFEISPAFKDIERVSKAINKIRGAIRC